MGPPHQGKYACIHCEGHCSRSDGESGHSLQCILQRCIFTVLSPSQSNTTACVHRPRSERPRCQWEHSNMLYKGTPLDQGPIAGMVSKSPGCIFCPAMMQYLTPRDCIRTDPGHSWPYCSICHMWSPVRLRTRTALQRCTHCSKHARSVACRQGRAQSGPITWRAETALS